MNRLPVEDPTTFYLRRRILEAAGLVFRYGADYVQFEHDIDGLPEPKRRLIEAALSGKLDWRRLSGLTAKEKVAMGVAAMEIEALRERIPLQDDHRVAV